MSCRSIDAEFLRANAPPMPEESGDKHSRGRVLIIAGSVLVPGAALLAGLGALRAGAGVLQIATCRSNATHLGLAMPEAMIMGCLETAGGEIDPSNVPRLVEMAQAADAVLIGPGLMDEASVAEVCTGLMCQVAAPVYVLDASAFTSLRSDQKTSPRLGSRIIVTPHAGEMAKFLKKTKAEVEEDPLAAARDCADRLGSVVVMKGARTFILSPADEALCFEGGTVALGTSGSGDVLAGVMAGMAARGAEPVPAAAWAVYLHGEAGRKWVANNGRSGLLAREIPEHIPSLLEELAPPPD